MALKGFKTTDFKDKDLMKLQENISEYVGQLNPVILSGILLEKTLGQTPIEITIGTTTTLVSHGLGRNYQGWQLLDLQGDARVWRDTSYPDNKDKFLPLIASASVKVKLWVF